jgi:6-pyruvoyltetrahydropterin/6-carboxytetrahydropterin synthase
MKIIKKKLSGFEAAHRLLDYQGKCHNLHGHSYKIYIELISYQELHLQDNGISIDFTAFKLFDKLIQQIYDHATLVNKDDVTLIAVLNGIGSKYVSFSGNSTVENIVPHIYNFLSTSCEEELKEINQVGFEKLAIEVYETENSSYKQEFELNRKHSNVTSE